MAKPKYTAPSDDVRNCVSPSAARTYGCLPLYIRTDKALAVMVISANRDLIGKVFSDASVEQVFRKRFVVGQVETRENWEDYYDLCYQGLSPEEFKHIVPKEL
jgi:hypothetical protein